MKIKKWSVKMKLVSIILLSLYSIANLFAGIYDLIQFNKLPLYIDIALIISGVIFILAIIIFYQEKKIAFNMVIFMPIQAVGRT